MNKIEQDDKLDFSNVLIRPKRSTINSRSEVDLSRTFKFMYSSYKWSGIPIIAANMDTTGTFEVYSILSTFKIITAMHKHYDLKDYKTYGIDKLDPNYYMISTGISDNDFIRLKEIMDFTNCNWICVDIANGYISNLVTFCKKVREAYPDKIIVAGNIVSREMVEELILNGKVDIVKVGIGQGSACLTRLQTGVGMPQLSAILECSDAAHGVGGLIIGDGGITCPGDMAKAFGGGADFVMMGGQFAGHDENPGDIVERNGEKYKLFYGMSSQHAMEKHYGTMNTYRSSEGRKIEIKYKGKLSNTVNSYLGGLRSTCTYINARHMKHIAKCTTFVKVTQQLNTHFINK